MMKRILFTSVATILFLGVAVLIYLGESGHPSPKNGQWLRVFVATRMYQEQLTKAGEAVPESVSLQVLVERNLLPASDALRMAGFKIRLLASPKSDDPTVVIMEITTPDATQVTLLADGSVHSMTIDKRFKSKPGL